jgi:hypothetical protein
MAQPVAHPSSVPEQALRDLAEDDLRAVDDLGDLESAAIEANDSAFALLKPFSSARNLTMFLTASFIARSRSSSIPIRPGRCRSGSRRGQLASVGAQRSQGFLLAYKFIPG